MPGTSLVKPGHDESRNTRASRKSVDGLARPRKPAGHDHAGATPAADLEVLGHHAVGPVHLPGVVRRSARGGGMAGVAAGRTVRSCGRDPRRRRRPDHFALRHHGAARRARRDLDRHALVAHAVCRLSRAALAVVASSGDRHRRAGRAGRRLGPAVARAGAGGRARFHGRRAEIGAVPMARCGCW